MAGGAPEHYRTESFASLQAEEQTVCEGKAVGEAGVEPAEAGGL